MVKKVKQAAAAPIPVVAKEEAPKEKKESGKAKKAQKEEIKKAVVAEPVVEKMEIDSDGGADDIDNEAVEGDSITIKQKKENAKKMLSAVKKFNAKLKSSIERKQIVKAVNALQGYYKKLKGEGAKATKNLLEAEDQYVQVTFTLTQVPERPTPRPLEIKLPHPFQGDGKEHDTRVCIFVKDPARAIKD